MDSLFGPKPSTCFSPPYLLPSPPAKIRSDVFNLDFRKIESATYRTAPSTLHFKCSIEGKNLSSESCIFKFISWFICDVWPSITWIVPTTSVTLTIRIISIIMSIFCFSEFYPSVLINFSSYAKSCKRIFKG